MAPRREQKGESVEPLTARPQRKQANKSCSAQNTTQRAWVEKTRSNASSKPGKKRFGKGKPVMQPGKKGKIEKAKPRHAIFPKGLPNPMPSEDPIRNDPGLIARLGLDWTSAQSKAYRRSIPVYQSAARLEKELHQHKLCSTQTLIWELLKKKLLPQIIKDFESAMAGLPRMDCNMEVDHIGPAVSLRSQGKNHEIHDLEMGPLNAMYSDGYAR